MVYELNRNREERLPLQGEKGGKVREILGLSGKKALDRILESEKPGELVETMSQEDFYWLVKKIGEEDCLPLLQFATTEQWQYLLDLEIWEKDRFSLSNASLWLSRLEEADSVRLAKWLLGKGQFFAYYYFFRSIRVEISEKEEEGLPEGFFSLDGVYNIEVTDPEYKGTIENIIRRMAGEHYERLQTLLVGLSRVIAPELEEEMYRLRNVRLAEQGFLPFEEAIRVYAPLEPQALEKKGLRIPMEKVYGEDTRDIVPLSPLQHVGSSNLLTEVAARTEDMSLLDGIRIEFAGLCNQILSAEGFLGKDVDALISSCRKAAGYLNLSLESLCGNDISLAEQIIRKHPLESVFRIGFGMALKLKWEAERWLKESWFRRRELEPGFWGDDRGGILQGLLESKPRFYVGLSEDGEFYRDFETLSELEECTEVIRRLAVLDNLLEKLDSKYKIDNEMLEAEEITFYPLLFNLWARFVTGIAPSFEDLSVKDAGRFFEKIRGEGATPPYRMAGWGEKFVKDFAGYAQNLGEEDKTRLGEVLGLIWQEFQDEYEWVSVPDLDPRYSRFLGIRPS